MARATSVDSTWVGELASGVSIGGSTLTLTTTSGTNWPSGSGVFGVQVGEDPDTDAELCQVTRSGSTLTLDASTLTKAHSAGAAIYYLTTAADINQFGAKYEAGATLLSADGTLSNPGQGFSSDPDNGRRRSTTNTMRDVAGGVDVEQYTSTLVTALVGFVLSAGLRLSRRNMTAATYNFSATGEAVIQVVRRSTGSTVNLPQISGSQAQFYIIVDPLGYLGNGGDLTLNAYDDGSGNYDSFNGEYDTPSTEVLTATGGTYLLFPNGQTIDPSGSGGVSQDWTLIGLSPPPRGSVDWDLTADGGYQGSVADAQHVRITGTSTNPATQVVLSDDFSSPTYVAKNLGNEVVVRDVSGNATAEPITVSTAFGEIDSGTNAIIDTDYGYVRLALRDGGFDTVALEGAYVV